MRIIVAEWFGGVNREASSRTHFIAIIVLKEKPEKRKQL